MNSPNPLKAPEKAAFLALLGGLLLAAAPARADYLPKFTGNTSPLNTAGQGVDGTIQFAVLELQGDSWGVGYAGFTRAFVPGTDAEGKQSAALDKKARYLYLYQVVNDGSNKKEISRSWVTLRVNPKAVTSWGHFTDLGFANKKGDVAAGKPFAGGQDFDQSAPARLGVDGPKVIAIGMGNDRGRNPRSVTLKESRIEAEWLGKDQLKEGTRSTLAGSRSTRPRKLRAATPSSATGPWRPPALPPPPRRRNCSARPSWKRRAAAPRTPP